jgi:hypothetical protein
LAKANKQSNDDAEHRAKLEARIAELEQALKDKQAEMERKLAELQAASDEAQRVLNAAMAQQKAAFEANIAALQSSVQLVNNARIMCAHIPFASTVDHRSW